MSTYEERLISLELTPISEIQKILHNHHPSSETITFLDVRTPEEIQAAPLLLPSSIHIQIQTTLRSITHPCSRTDATTLVQVTTEDPTFLPQKDGIVVIFCKSGARAKMGKSALEQLGYTRVSSIMYIDGVSLEQGFFCPYDC